MVEQPFNLDACLEDPNTKLEALRLRAVKWINANPSALPKLMWVLDSDLGWLLSSSEGLVLGRVFCEPGERLNWSRPWKWEVLPSYRGINGSINKMTGHYSTCNPAKRRLRQLLPTVIEFRAVWQIKHSVVVTRGGHPDA